MCSAQTQPAPKPTFQSQPRPKIALALSGGAAYGLTQFGALEWLEEHRIPVDGIAGTSGGAIVGAWYATGLELLSDDEIAHPITRSSQRDMRLHGISEVLSHLDLDGLFRAFPNYPNVDIQDKQLQAQFPFGPLGGLAHQEPVLTDGIVPGQSLENIFGRICEDFPVGFLYRNDGRAPFDHLPTPFRAVAVQPHGYDLHQWQQFSLGETSHLPLAPEYKISLPDAIRASMAIPYVFTPRYIPPSPVAGQYRYSLVDGGIRDNYPTDVACDSFKPDVLIGCEISVDLKPLSDFFRLTGHPPTDQEIEDRSNQFKLGTHLSKRPTCFSVPMDAGRSRPDRFDDWRHLAWLGYLSMEHFSKTPAGQRLLRYELPLDQYMSYRIARREVKKQAESLVRPSSESVRFLEREASKTGMGSVGFHPIDESKNRIDYFPRVFGNFQIFAMPEIGGGSGDWTSADVAILAKDYGILNRKSSLDLGLKLGVANQATFDVNLVPDHGSYYIRPYATADSEQQSFFAKGERVDNLFVPSEGIGVEAGLLVMSKAKLSLATEVGKFSDPAIPYRQAIARLAIDTTNSNTDPDSGFKGSAFGRVFGEDESRPTLYQSEMNIQWMVRQGAGNKILFQSAAGTSFGGHPDSVLDFRLGGSSLMKGYPEEYIRTDGFLYEGISYHLRLEKIPFYLGNFNLIGGVENTQVGSVSYNDAYSSLEIASRLGTFSAGVGVSNHNHLQLFVGFGSAPVSGPKLFGISDR